MEFYGSLDNRLEENKMYCEKIEVGTGMTEYSYSDRKAYEVIKVVDQGHVFVREYDHKKADDIPMSNNWELVSNQFNPVRELKFRYGKWNWVIHYTRDSIKNCVIYPKCYQEVIAKGYGIEYSSANVSFGVADYYYDYSF